MYGITYFVFDFLLVVPAQRFEMFDVVGGFGLLFYEEAVVVVPLGCSAVEHWGLLRKK